MSASLTAPVASPKADPFRFGWRYVQRTLPNGQIRTDLVPLTLEDALHPQEEDRYTVSDPHTRDLRYLTDVFEARLADVPEAIVLSDCRIAWDETNLFAHGPDIAVIFGVPERRRWSTFNVVEEGTRPALIVEVTSPSTRVNDVEVKVREYARVGVPRYVIVDADEENGDRTISFVHYQLPAGSSEYVEVPESANGRIWLPEVRVWLDSGSGQVVCHDERGQPIIDYVELTRARTASDQRAELESLRADAAEQAIAVEVEARMSDNRARREAELRAVDAERRATEQAAQNQQLLEELRRLRGEAANE